MHPLARCLVPKFRCLVLDYFYIHMQFYQLLADDSAGFFEVWVVCIYRRCRNGYHLCWLHLFTLMMDMSFLPAWFFPAFFPSVWNGFMVWAL